MTQGSEENIVEVKPSFNVYTAMILISIISLLIGIYFVVQSLFMTGPDGYNLKEISDLWTPPIEDKKQIDREIGEVPDRSKIKNLD